MFTVVVMPLSEYLAGEEEDFELAAEMLTALQETLGEEVGANVFWDEAPGDYEASDADDLDDDSVNGLWVAAAFFDLRGTIAGCDPGDEPAVHPIFEELEARQGSKQFRQLLHADAEVVCYAPVSLPDVYFWPFGPEEPEEDAEDVEGVAMGSLPALLDELETLREALGLPERLDDIDVVALTEDESDALAPAKIAWFVLMDRAQEASTAKLPLMLFYSVPDEHEEH